MDLFEQGKLKGQKINLSSLTSKPEFKQQYLAPIRTLLPAQQVSILQKILDKEITILDIKKIAVELKSLNGLKTAFIKLTNCESWEMAVEKYPLFATEAKLKLFFGYNLKVGIPNCFQDYCKRAKLSVNSQQQEEPPFTFNGISVKFICANFVDVSGQLVQSTCSSFSGIDLAVIVIQSEVTTQ